MTADCRDQEAVRFALSELHRYALRAAAVSPERLLELLVDGPKTQEERRILATILESSRSAGHLEQLVGLGALPGPALVRTVRSLAVAKALKKKIMFGLGRDDLIAFAEELREGQEGRVAQGLAAPTPLPRKRGRAAADPLAGPQTDAERQQARGKRLRAEGFRKRSFWLSAEALAALKALRSRAEPGTKLEDIVNAALISTAEGATAKSPDPMRVASPPGGS